jgi:hypothetical protein
MLPDRASTFLRDAYQLSESAPASPSCILHIVLLEDTRKNEMISEKNPLFSHLFMRTAIYLLAAIPYRQYI